MKVKKFGGTSVGSAERIRNVGKLIADCKKDIVVLSAMSGTTNSLLEISGAVENNDRKRADELANALQSKYAATIDDLYTSEEYKAKAKEVIDGIFDELRALTKNNFSVGLEKEIVAKGEMMSTNLMNLHLHELGINSVLIPALDIVRIDMHGEPDEAFIRTEAKKALEAHTEADLYITQGFICRNEKGETDNLQRGGSDYTASLLGALLGADEIEIWTDIDGMHNNDPRFVEGTTPVRNLHFEEAAELAYFGAKILHPTCILPARQHNVPVRLLNTMDPAAEGTLIENKLERNAIKAVAAKDNITAIKIKSGRMLLAYGFLKKVFEIFEKYETSIDMITTSEVGVSLTIDNEKNLPRIEAELSQLGTVTIDRDMVIICVVGDLEWTNRGFEAAALEALRNVPVRMISYGGSNYNISFLVRKEDKTKALRLLSYHLF
ncbi:MAG: aspartate kinase [Muribaculaceae bacterium]|nr:aspartate kinase [Muribaculaceae bacterium]